MDWANQPLFSRLRQAGHSINRFNPRFRCAAYGQRLSFVLLIVVLSCFSSHIFAARPAPPPAAPSIKMVTPSSGDTVGGTAVTITGSGFQAGASVNMGGISASSVSVIDPGKITATVPPHASGLVDVTVINADGTKATLSDGFLYVVATICDPNALSDMDPSITIESPATLTEIVGDSVLVSGTFSGPTNVGINVNGVVAVTDGGSHFYTNYVPLVSGSNMLVATITTPLGKTASTQVDITSNSSDMLKLHVTPVAATVGSSVLFSYEYKGVAPIQAVTVDFGDGIVSTYTPIQAISHSYSSIGVFIVTLSTRDSQGISLSTRYALQVSNTASFNTTHLVSIANFRNALACGQDNIALGYFSPHSRSRYQPILSALKSVLPQIVNTWSDPQEVLVTSNHAEYAINQVIDGINRIFFLNFIRDDDGVWRIEEM